MSDSLYRRLRIFAEKVGPLGKCEIARNGRNWHERAGRLEYRISCTVCMVDADHRWTVRQMFPANHRATFAEALDCWRQHLADAHQEARV